MKNAARKIIRYSTRALYVKSQQGGSSAYIYLYDIRELVKQGIEFTFEDRTGEWTTEDLLTRAIFATERENPSDDTRLLSKILRNGGVRNYIEKLEKRI